MTRRVRRATLAALAACAALPAAAQATAKVEISKPATPGVAEQTACFTSTGPDGSPLSVFGRRFTVGTPAPDAPAIVLVHGVGTDADLSWDPTPSWSLARWLAAAGYVVFTYDRPGYHNTPYAGSGDDITVDANQVVLHDVVSRIHDGRYATGPASGTCRPGQTTSPTGPASARVAIIGHSGGGFIVSTYPGRYHDVVAMVQANSPSGVSSVDPPGNAALLSLTTQAPADANDEAGKGPMGDPSGDGTAPAAADGYTLDNATRPGCENFNFWRARAAAAVATIVCDPASAQPIPSGETGSYVQQAARNQTLMPATGDIPVLLAGADHDVIMPANANQLELGAWKANCGCDVSQFILKDTGHFFAGHTSLVEWTTRVTDWLTDKGVAARTPADVQPRVFPPQDCGPVVVRVRLGKAGRRARAISTTVAGVNRHLKPRSTVTLRVPHAAAQTAAVAVRVRSRTGRLSVTRRTVALCGAVT